VEELVYGIGHSPTFHEEPQQRPLKAAYSPDIENLVEGFQGYGFYFTTQRIRGSSLAHPNVRREKEAVAEFL